MDENLNLQYRFTSNRNDSDCSANIVELLEQVIAFTQQRNDIIINNIKNAGKEGFCPVDLPAAEFSKVLENAVDEHVLRNRLLYCDTDNIKFGLRGTFRVKPVIDESAAKLMDRDIDEYINYQVNLNLENAMNQHSASELLKTLQSCPDQAFISAGELFPG